MAVQISGNDITVPRDGSFTRNVTIGGTLTYEDVTNIDSVGLVTARTGIEIGARPGVAASISVDGNMIVSGITTFTHGGSEVIRINSGGLLAYNDISFFGASTHAYWDHSANQFALNDNTKLSVGNSSDLSIYHNGSDSYIEDSGTGALVLKTNQLSIRNAADDEQLAKFIQDSSVELYHNNSKKLETTSYGTLVTGRLTTTGNITAPDSAQIQLGDSIDLALYHDGGNSWILNDTGNLIIKDLTDAVYIQAPSIIFQDETTAENIARFISDGAVELYHNNEKKLYTYTDGVFVQDDSSAGAYLVIATNAGTQGSLYGTSNTLGFLDGQNHYMLKGVKDGALELYHDNSKKFETTATGIKVISDESRIVQYDESIGVNERKVIYRGLGNTASGTFTASNCHGGGTVTVVGMNNGNGNISTTKMYPIHINSNGTATLGSIIFEINGSTSASSFSVSAAAQGISVTNGGGAFCQFRVTFDITANVS